MKIPLKANRVPTRDVERALKEKMYTGLINPQTADGTAIVFQELVFPF
jgi:hypothetical protein